MLLSPMYLLLLWALITLQVRRLHDLNLSGFWILLPAPFSLVESNFTWGTPTGLLPLITTTLLALTLVLDGTRGLNRFGADPKERVAIEKVKQPEHLAFVRGFDRLAATVTVATTFLVLTGSSLLGSASALIPSGLAARIGNTLAAQTIPRYWRCSAPDAERVLGRLAARLAPGLSARITYTTYPDAGGLALPGGRIIIGQSAVRAAEGPQELAGVLAHELAHSMLRHPERKLVSSAALSLLPSGLAGPYGMVRYGWELPYSRELENEADAQAAQLMQQAGMAPAHLATILGRFERLGRSRGRTQVNSRIAWQSTHPTTPDRIKKLMRYSVPLTEQLAMSNADWFIVRKGCKS